MARTLAIITSFNRPTLVKDAIRSILDGDDKDVRLAIMDDGSNGITRQAISEACGYPGWMYGEGLRNGIVAESGDNRVTWWHGPQRSIEDRRSYIPYSFTLNLALGYLLRDERYVCYIVDDDFLYPESIKARADYLDANPDVHVVYGRTRSIEYDNEGFNKWASSARPQAGMAFPRPAGVRQHEPGVGGKRCYFAASDEWKADPQTGLPYVDEGYWEPGWLDYGKPHRVDHNQVMHRVECLKSCRAWPILSRGGHAEYWGEDNSHGVGDASFFDRLAEVHQFWGLDAWVCSKRFHSRSWGTPDNEVRE